MKNVFRTCALGVGVTAMFAASAFATTFQSERVSIPFEFHVAKMTLPAGDYKVQQVFGSGIAYLVNMKTGQQVQNLRSVGSKVDGRAKLVFETKDNGYRLKTIS